jgi:hypothetical protein
MNLERRDFFSFTGTSHSCANVQFLFPADSSGICTYLLPYYTQKNETKRPPDSQRAAGSSNFFFVVVVVFCALCVVRCALCVVRCATVGSFSSAAMHPIPIDSNIYISPYAFLRCSDSRIEYVLGCTWMYSSRGGIRTLTGKWRSSEVSTYFGGRGCETKKLN